MLKNSLVVVTGGSRGIGRTFAHNIGQAGARVVITGRNKSTLEKTASELGHNVFPVAFDITNCTETCEAFDYIESQYGSVTSLVNNAGVEGPVEFFYNTDPAAWIDAVNTNLNGTVNCTSAVLKRMVSRQEGQIINLVSNAGAFRWPGCSSYSVAKAAIIKLTENLAVELQPYKIALFAYDPGLIHSAGMMVDDRYGIAAPGSLKSKIWEWFLNEKEAGRTVDASLGAEAISQLCTGQHNNLSGRYLTVHDKLDELLVRAEEICQQDLLTLRVRSLSSFNIK